MKKLTQTGGRGLGVLPMEEMLGFNSKRSGVM